MKNAQLLAWFIVLVGSFLPLVKIPIVGNWNYWDIDHYLATMVWVFCGFILIGIFTNKQALVRFSALLLLILFGFTIFAVKFKSLDYFSFLPFKSWQKSFAGIVKLSWAWIFEFAGAIALLVIKKSK